LISIGAVYKGPELHGSRINRLIMAMSAVLKELQGTLSSETWLNAVFVVPGSLGDPESIYLTYADEFQNDNGVVVNIPMPRSVANGTDGQLKYVVNALHGACAMATLFFEERNQEFVLRKAQAIVTRAAQRISLFPPDSI
jgi:hypothetical protein